MANKIDFNTPFLTETGEPVRRPVYDKNKAKLDQNGNPIPAAVLDAEGNVVYENVMVKDLLVQILNAAYEGDGAMGFNERVARGKLCRKVADSTKGSLKNYTTEELKTIKDLSIKVASTALLVQLDDLIEGTGEPAADAA